ncbi:hypothetical protein D3C79_1098760 [compost metagenome]
MKLCASMPLVRLTRPLPRNSSAWGASTLRKALDGRATKINSLACKVASRSLTGSTPSCRRMPLR